VNSEYHNTGFDEKVKNKSKNPSRPDKMRRPGEVGFGGFVFCFCREILLLSVKGYKVIEKQGLGEI
jgi:hypothetical protein